MLRSSYFIAFMVAFLLFCNTVKANKIIVTTLNNDTLKIELTDSVIATDSTLLIPQKKVKFKRGKAIIFTILTGLLGGHRIYLGTHQRVPIIYAITLGGFGILPLIDLVNIIFTKDLSKFEHNPKVIMWGK